MCSARPCPGWHAWAARSSRAAAASQSPGVCTELPGLLPSWGPRGWQGCHRHPIPLGMLSIPKVGACSIPTAPPALCRATDRLLQDHWYSGRVGAAPSSPHSLHAHTHLCKGACDSLHPPARLWNPPGAACGAAPLLGGSRQELGPGRAMGTHGPNPAHPHDTSARAGLGSGHFPEWGRRGSTSQPVPPEPPWGGHIPEELLSQRKSYSPAEGR